jgi:hypothetical protein
VPEAIRGRTSEDLKRSISEDQQDEDEIIIDTNDDGVNDDTNRDGKIDATDRLDTDGNAVGALDAGVVLDLYRPSDPTLTGRKVVTKEGSGSRKLFTRISA